MDSLLLHPNEVQNFETTNENDFFFALFILISFYITNHIIIITWLRAQLIGFHT